MAFIVGFIIGFLFGVFLPLVLACLVVASDDKREGEEQEKKY